MAEDEKMLIDFAYLGDLIKEYELWIEEKNLNIDEQKLLLDIIQGRRQDKLMKLKTTDTLGGLPFADLIKKATKSA